MAVLADVLEIPLRVISGYDGNADTALAVIKGDGDGDGHITGWSASQAVIEAGDEVPILTLGQQRYPDFPEVPTALELVDGASRDAVQAIVNMLDMRRGFFGPPDLDPTATAELRLRTCLRPRGVSPERTVGLRGEKEIALGETLNLVSPDLHDTARPGNMQVRVVILGLGDLRDPVGEIHGIDKVAKAELPFEVTCFVQPPTRVQFGQQFPGAVKLHRRYAAAARNTLFVGKVHSKPASLMNRPNWSPSVHDDGYRCGFRLVPSITRCNRRSGEMG